MSTQPPVNSTFTAAEEDETAPTTLARIIAGRIADGGPMTFRDYMEQALYEPGRGYYARPRAPWSGAADFVTAPQVDAAVGAAVARLAEACDASLGGRERFDVVEFGGGDGILLADICTAIQQRAPGLYERLAVTCVERGEASVDLQRGRLAAHAPRVRWVEVIDGLEPGSLSGLVVSNELLDAFAVHRVVRRAGTLREIRVGVEDGRLVELEAAPSTAELQGYLDFNDITLADGQVVEISLEAGAWLDKVATKLARGFVLTIDYGAETRALYAPERAAGTLVCQHRYQLNDDPYRRVGEQDITAHVDFGNVRRRGSLVGLEAVGGSSLAVFLVGFGAGEEIGGDVDGGDEGDVVRRSLGLRHLLFTEIGDAHRVLLQAKGVSAGFDFGTSRLG